MKDGDASFGGSVGAGGAQHEGGGRGTGQRLPRPGL